MISFLTALKRYSNPKILSFFGLGLASQAPVNLIGGTLKYWFSTLGVDITQIGLFSLVLIPYALKFLWAPFIDQINLPFFDFLGRKKKWGLLAQILVMILLMCLSGMNPQTETTQIFVICLGIAFFSATQDIVIDALRIDVLEGTELEQGTSAYQFGARIGMLLAVAGMIFLSSYLSWYQLYLLSAMLVFIGFVSLMILPEKQVISEKKSFAQLVTQPFLDLIRRRGILVLCLFVIAYKLCNGVLGPMAYPFYNRIGFTPEEISLMSGTFGVFVTMFGIFLGGLISVRFSSKSLLFWLGFLEIFTSFAFAIMAEVGPSLFCFFWVIVFDNLVGGIGGVVWVSYLSGLCNRSFSGTQYAFFAALNMIPLSVMSSSGGVLVDMFGWSTFFIITGLLMIPALIMIKTVRLEKLFNQ